MTLASDSRLLTDAQHGTVDARKAAAWLRRSAGAALLLCVAALPGCRHGHRALHHGKPMQRSRFFTPLPPDDPLRGNMVPVHDPSLARREDGTYVVFDTDVPFLRSEHAVEMRCSRDLQEWHGCGYVFARMPAWVEQEFPEVARAGQGVWAPDISYFGGSWHLYYAVSTLGSQHSAIALATTPTLDPQDPRYGWTDHGAVLRSDAGQDFNAIDANVLVEPGSPARVWLNYGSFWSGIYQQELDPATGRLHPGSIRYHLAEQPRDRGGAIEGAAMATHNGWYYLFASVGLCCDIPIERDTYREIVGRSRSVHGPFMAEDGSPLLRGGGTVLLESDARWLAPGGGSISQSADEASTLIAFHALDRRRNGALDLWVERVAWSEDWPVLAPVR